jgi:hypothetical protein
MKGILEEELDDPGGHFSCPTITNICMPWSTLAGTSLRSDYTSLRSYGIYFELLGALSGETEINVAECPCGLGLQEIESRNVCDLNWPHEQVKNHPLSFPRETEFQNSIHISHLFRS